MLRKWIVTINVWIQADSPRQQQQQWKCKSRKRLPGCYAQFITFAILLGNRINQGPFIRNLKKKKKTVDSLGGCGLVLTVLMHALILSILDCEQSLFFFRFSESNARNEGSLSFFSCLSRLAFCSTDYIHASSLSLFLFLQFPSFLDSTRECRAYDLVPG